MTYNKTFQVEGIKNLITRNYRLPTDIFDIDAMVDKTLTFQENWNIIKPKVLMLVKDNPGIQHDFQKCEHCQITNRQDVLQEVLDKFEKWNHSHIYKWLNKELIKV